MEIYELSVNARVYWQAHSLSNAGSNGSNRLYPRRQLLANGVEVDACSGNILKHYHAYLLAEYFEQADIPLCPACANRDGRRAGALPGEPYNTTLTMRAILTGCGMCDAHGFLVTSKKSKEKKDDAPRRLAKHSLLEFGFALALPDQQAETIQLTTRTGGSKGEGQMIMKKSSRSGGYALNLRYKASGIGVDTNLWITHLSDPAQRRARHIAILQGLRDQILSPSGALTSTMLPHLTGLSGAIVIQSGVGRAPIYSPLADDFIEQLTIIASDTHSILEFHNAGEFATVMKQLIDASLPAMPVGADLAVERQK